MFLWAQIISRTISWPAKLKPLPLKGGRKVTWHAYISSIWVYGCIGLSRPILTWGHINACYCLLDNRWLDYCKRSCNGPLVFIKASCRRGTEEACEWCIIVPVQYSRWEAPFVLIMKKMAVWEFVGTLRSQLSKLTRGICIPYPELRNCFLFYQGRKYFSKLDIS